jgi:hypothetical protein
MSRFRVDFDLSSTYLYLVEIPCRSRFFTSELEIL